MKRHCVASSTRSSRWHPRGFSTCPKPCRRKPSSWTHKTTTDLTRRFGVIGIENLNVKWTLANDKLSRAISDLGLYEFRRQIEYKAALSGGTIVVVDRGFPSSKTCSSCGAYCASMPLSIREWVCPDCGTRHDRDVNAALNIEREALATGSGPGSHACGEEGVGQRRKTPAKPASMKQEVTHGLLSLMGDATTIPRIN